MSQRDLVAELQAARIQVRSRCASAFARSPPRRRAAVASLPAPPLARAARARRRRARRRGRGHAPERAPTASRSCAGGPASQPSRTGAEAAPSASVPAPPLRKGVRADAVLDARAALRRDDRPAGRLAERRLERREAALAITAALGGHPTSVHASSADKTGVADLVLRIPRRHVQEAVTRLSQLGTITSEQVDVQDLQAGVDATARRIARLQRRLATLRAEPQTPERDRAIAAITAQVERLQRAEAATVRSAQLATLRLHVATPPAAQPAHQGHGPLHGIGTAAYWTAIGARLRARVRDPADRGRVADLADRPDGPAAARRRAAQPDVSCAKTRNVGLPTGSSENSGFTQPSWSKRDS